MRQRRVQHAQTSATKATSASSAPSSSRNDTPRTAPERGNTALIQFRLSDGSTVRQQFQAANNLAALFHFVAGKEDHTGKPLADGEELKLISVCNLYIFGSKLTFDISRPFLGKSSPVKTQKPQFRQQV